MKRIFVIAVFILIVSESFGQQKPRFFTGFFPEISLTKKLNQTQKLNFKVENQHVWFDNRQPDIFQFSHYRTDIMGFFDQSIRPGKSLGFGLFHRFQDGSDANRLVQQYVYLQRFRSYRLNHRFRTDQTFTKGEAVELRFRYRLSSEIALQGEEVDVGEFYLNSSAESIFSLQDSDFEIENRIALALGKLLDPGEKIEWGIDYRTDGYVQNGFRTRLWAKISYYLNF